VAGTVGAIVTCPLEVVKTRQQSSRSGFHEPMLPQIAQDFRGSKSTTFTTVPVQSRYVAKATPSMSILQCLKHIIKHEGPIALFKGENRLALDTKVAESPS
ncbi:hypothetical protein Trydic_g15994, partial [Trypoxylus dichotomus]